ncbi:hypothetical protein XNW1_3850122 [Xenorhabdus nematophila str. Websteri]|nr:hypothetical protein XNA1_120035 [Xenorhabdus nematophila str. Anatoliense]CEE95256.1 hypothetical protein XNA1_5020036 [Xenorhabdus nematophila str. Anatoliense]CEF31627.1 hypothetical protein XNW1_3850122 [Xenorhabdus nematophila str. Websteri]
MLSSESEIGITEIKLTRGEEEFILKEKIGTLNALKGV